jgi:hypothetical protein
MATRKKAAAYTSNNTISKTAWNQSNRDHSKFIGYNAAGIRVEQVGAVDRSSDGWKGTNVLGDIEVFNRRADAMSFVTQGFNRASKNSPTYWNPGFLAKLKGAAKKVKAAVSPKARKTKTLIDRLDWDKKNKGRRSNPEDEAKEVYQEFHGVPSKEVIEYQTRFQIHENLAGLGQLTELVFFTPGAKPERVVLETEDIGDGVWLCCSEDCKQLYILGDVDVDLEALGYRPDVDVKDCVELGRLTNVIYRTQKEFHELKMLDYDHRLGKREAWQKREGVGPDMNKAVAECPVLAYHTRENRLTVIGGQYLILPEGITN